MYSVYKYTNVHNQKVYIGQTSLTLEERAQSNGHNYCQCPRFYEAIKKYSWQSFVPEILETVETHEEAVRLEAYYIALYNSADEKYGYNVMPSVFSMSSDTRHTISEKAKARYSDGVSNPMYGKKHSEHALEIMREKKLGENNPMYGKKWTETQRARCGTRGKKLNLSDEQRDAMRERIAKIGATTGLRPVKCVEDDAEFPSIKAAAEVYGVRRSTLCGHLRGAQKTCKGKHFVYLD